MGIVRTVPIAMTPLSSPSHQLNNMMVSYKLFNFMVNSISVLYQ